MKTCIAAILMALSLDAQAATAYLIECQMQGYNHAGIPIYIGMYQGQFFQFQRVFYGQMCPMSVSDY